jgi:chromate transporter
MSAQDYFSLFTHFMLFSLMAVSGAITVVPEMHRFLVDDKHWLTELQFASSIAIAQAAPGPNILFVAVMGFQTAGLTGTALTMLGILIPSTTLAFAVARFGRKREDWLPVRAFKAGMAPITIALMLSAAWVLTRNLLSSGTNGTDSSSWWLIALSVAAALMSWRTNMHVLVLIAAGAVVGALLA